MYMNKKLLNQLGIGILVIIIISIFLSVTNIVPGKYLDETITFSGCIVGIIIFINFRKEKRNNK